MKRIGVYLQYPWRIKDSPYYQYLLKNPPIGIDYISDKKEGMIIEKNNFILFNLFKSLARRMLNFFSLSIPNSHLTKTKQKYDLIHCAHCLSKNKDKPWVADFEGGWQMYIGEKTKTSFKKVRKILMKENCKKIIPWTELTGAEILKNFPEIKDKIKVIYPAIPLQNFKKNKNKIPTIIYVSRYFKIKGGLIALETLKRLKKECNFNTIFIADVPEDIKKIYSNIKILGLMDRDILNEEYKKSDIFFYPSAVDTFGFALIEAMSFGLPIVTINTKYTKTRKEIIKNGFNGFITDVKQDINLESIGPEEGRIIERLKDDLKKLIKNKNLRQKMSKNCIEEVKNGKFSINRRNEKLRKIYEEAIRL